MIKRHFLIALLLVLCLCLAACGNTQKPATETPDEPQSLTPDEPQGVTPDDGEISSNAQMLLSEAEPPVDMEPVKREHYGNGSYYYMDVAGENALRCVSSCYQNTIKADETEEEYAERRAIGMSVTMSPGLPYNVMVGLSEELSQELGQPVYLVTFLTGSDLNATCWTVYLTRTAHYSYQYAFAAGSQTSLEMEETFMEYFKTLKLVPLTEQ